ncbi:enoyl-CoA hydratase/isomerase family protein [Sphingomonas cavernae]|uniref:enoyl-CoA hydratase/isomerase family protein n=1 Tax=Sphingomonas cavernae TaxID=2320861 RepID=UPI001C720A15|nr:enoyl-CoA hydratase/isomerase family protein [Sphingomonas cavernae]
MPISYSKAGAVGWLVLDRPDALNSLDRESVQQFTERLATWRDDASVRVLVVTGSGRAFCAGADLKQAGSKPEPGEKDLLDLIVILFDALRSFPKPVIAAVNGLAFAGGLEVVLCCDLVIAAETARFGDAHSNFGVFPGGGGAAILPRKIPANVARYLLFTGEALSAADARLYGLVNEVVPAGELETHVQALADRLAAKSPLVLAGMKRVANEAADKSAADALRHELLECRNHGRSWDITEGLAAFREKREPQFKGY